MNFLKNMVEDEQLELCNLLDKFLIHYENDFEDLMYAGKDDVDVELLLDEFKSLYRMIKRLEDWAVEHRERTR